MPAIASTGSTLVVDVVPPPYLVMVTAHGREDVLKRAPAAGIEAVLIKPVSPSLLFDTAIRMLGSVPAGEPDHGDRSRSCRGSREADP